MLDTSNTFSNVEAMIDKFVSERKDEEESLKEELLSEIEDDRFLKAVALAVKNGEISTVLIQRKLSVGYGTAIRMIYAMEALGLIGAHEKGQPRKTLKKAEEYLSYRSEN